MAEARPIPHRDGRFVAMPLGGIGTGNVSICADGGLRQWQLHNSGNHRGDLPWTFFAIRAGCIEPPVDVVRVLQAPVPDVDAPRTPLVTDDEVPGWQRELQQRWQSVEATTFSATYPEAQVDYHDDALPVSVQMVASTPMVPGDVDESSLPVATFTFEITNTHDQRIYGWLGSTCQNAVGSDGYSPVDGVSSRTYGGNTNRLLREAGWTKVIMENGSLPPDHPGAGQMVLATDSPTATSLVQWQSPEEFGTFLGSRAWGEDPAGLRLAPWMPDSLPNSPREAAGPSAAGRTWNTGLAHRFDLDPGETTTVRVMIAWHFGNRYTDFGQFGPSKEQWGPSRFFLGNAYARRHPNAEAVVDHVTDRWDTLADVTRSWVDTLRGSSLSPDQTEHLAAQAAYLRSPSCFRTATGRFHGFEGVLGASTRMWNGDLGGSCPLNCTHVWNYAQAVSAFYPSLEQNMRETEFDVMQHASGYLPHRVIAPAFLPQLWDTHIGGPEEPALDGMLGSVLKTYREVRRGAGTEWLATYWPNVCRLLDHIHRRWDPERTGLLHGIQPSTHDIDLSGINSFMGTLWLAPLRAAEEMATRVGEDQTTEDFGDRLTHATSGYDEALFDGNHYVQKLEEGDNADFQWVTGVLSDQLIGQWWAHTLDLGHLLPVDHVRTALRTVVATNLRHGFADFTHGYRVFADADDSGLLMCSWPEGGRPAVPTRYADEVWTGIEYQVAAHCLQEGLREEAEQVLDAVWQRYDGTRRNPYNEIECGDHYVRAMAGWSVLEALGGYTVDAVTRTVQIGPGRDGRWPIMLPGAWGWLVRDGD
ncbi:MAG: non-lysosomal glucosylceramidase, partial [Propionibacteriales bacterium]|nr:non-lysosomal glucosylceramidase [Propionibacteriales bacterium]